MFFIESFLVGLYASIVYLIMQSFIKGIILLLFSIGFCKHFAGYFLQMHTYFCNRCNVPYHNLNNYVAKHKYLLIDSTLEGIYFLVVGYLFFNLCKKLISRFSFIFLIGMLTHIIAEYAGIHTFFCNKRCIAY